MAAEHQGLLGSEHRSAHTARRLAVCRPDGLAQGSAGLCFVGDIPRSHQVDDQEHQDEGERGCSG